MRTLTVGLYTHREWVHPNARFSGVANLVKHALDGSEFRATVNTTGNGKTILSYGFALPEGANLKKAARQASEAVWAHKDGWERTPGRTLRVYHPGNLPEALNGAHPPQYVVVAFEQQPPSRMQRVLTSIKNVALNR